MNKVKRTKLILLVIIVSAIFLSGLIFCNFTKLGYMITIRWHGFTEVRDNIFLDKDNLEDADNILNMLDSANNRIGDFWGELKGSPTIIISYQEKKLSKLGYTGSPAITNTYVLNGAHNYVVVSNYGVDIDILSHELAHAELHTRIYKNKWIVTSIIPIWFDEGIAMQNDYRDKYNEDVWEEVTDNGEDIRNITSLNTNEFFNSDKEVRIENFVLAKHELCSWINEHGHDKLIHLLEDVNTGGKFEELYVK